MQFEVTGKVIEVLPKSSGISARTGNEWRKLKFAIKTSDKYPVVMAFDLWDARIDEYSSFLDMTIPLDERPEVLIKFTAESVKSKTGTYFTTCTAFYMSENSAATSAAEAETKSLEEVQAELVHDYGVSKK